MYAIALIRYRRALEEVMPHVDAHRAYLQGLYDNGWLLVSGPFEPRVGGALLLRVRTETSVRHSIEFATRTRSFGRAWRSTNSCPGNR